MAESNLHGIMDEADSDLSGTMYEYSGNHPTGSNIASDIKYDNSSSGLTAENVQEAIDEIAQNSTGGVSNYDLLSNRPKINGVTLSGNLSPENIGAMPMFTGSDETDPDTSLKGIMFVTCSDELKAILGMPRAYIHQYFYSTGAIAENQTRLQIAVAYGDVAKMAIRQFYGSPKSWTSWKAFSGGESGADGGYYVPSVDDDGNLSWTASEEDMPYVESSNIKGNDGIGIQSVEQTTTSTEDGGENVITVTKTDGNKSTFTTRNGRAGYTPQKYVDYFDGQDGVSPTVSIEKITNGHGVTFTDVNGPKVVNIMDGAALLYIVSPGELIEEARIAAKAAGARFIFNPYVANSVEYVTASSFNTLFDARNGAVLLWSGSKAAGASASFTIETGSAGCTGLGNLSDYKLFIFIIAGNIPYLMSMSSESAGFAGGLLMYSSGELSLVVRGMRASVSGNTFTVTDHKTFKVSTSTTSNSTSSLNAIYGIPIR